MQVRQNRAMNINEIEAKSPYGYAGHVLSKLTEPLSDMGDRLQEIKGVNITTAGIITEILNTRDSTLYRQLLSE